ncbi:MAG: response regulator [Desulfovibrionaceae bacterium]
MKRQILVVDDEKPTLDMLEMLLSAYGYEVLKAENGREALELYELEKPPIVLTDIKMPIMDGMEVLGRIKEINQLAEVIVITGHGDMDLAITALNLDATDFINKPVQRKALDQALKRAENRIRMAESKVEEITLEIEEQAAVVHTKGSLTAASEPFLNKAFDAALDSGRPVILVVFAENSSINGAGIALMTQILVACRDKGVAVRFVGVHENIRKVFEIVGITKLVSIHPDRQSALEAS